MQFRVKLRPQDSAAVRAHPAEARRAGDRPADSVAGGPEAVAAREVAVEAAGEALRAGRKELPRFGARSA